MTFLEKLYKIYKIFSKFKLVLREGLEPPSRPYQSLDGYKPSALTNCAIGAY